MTGKLLLVPTDHPARLQGTPLISLSLIRVGQRQRTDLGALDELASSISGLGLFQPILFDKQLNLVAGARQLVGKLCHECPYLPKSFRKVATTLGLGHTTYEAN